MRANVTLVTNAFRDYNATITDDSVNIKGNRYRVLGTVFCGKTPVQPSGDYPSAQTISSVFPDTLVISKLIEDFGVSSITSYKAGEIVQQCYFNEDEDHGEHCICSDPQQLL